MESQVEMEEGGEGRYPLSEWRVESSRLEMEESGEEPWWKPLSRRAKERAARAARGEDFHLVCGVRSLKSPVDLSTYVDRSEYPPLARIEVEHHWDKRRGRMVSVVPKWAQEEYAARTNTPSNESRIIQTLDHKQLTDAASSAKHSPGFGTKALKHPPVENPSAADPCGTEALKRPRVEHPLVGKLVHPNSASEVTAADKARRWASLIADKARRWASLRAAARARKPYWLEGPILVHGKGKFEVLLPTGPMPPIEKDAGAEVK